VTEIAITQETVAPKLLGFIRAQFLSGDDSSELDEETPLLEWGVLNSLNVATLMNYIRDELGITIPPVELNAGNFKNVRMIAALVAEIAAAGDR
jgi:acyl carrier protein